MSTLIHRDVAERLYARAKELEKDPVIINLKGMPGYWESNLRLRLRQEKYSPDEARKIEITESWRADITEWRQTYFELHGKYPEEVDKRDPAETI